jgi:hypothetical protein
MPISALLTVKPSAMGGFGNDRTVRFAVITVLYLASSILRTVQHSTVAAGHSIWEIDKAVCDKIL